MFFESTVSDVAVVLPGWKNAVIFVCFNETVFVFLGAGAVPAEEDEERFIDTSE